MILNRYGKEVHPDAIAVSDTAVIKTIHVVRLIKDEGIRKTVVAEEKFEHAPTKQQLLYCLAKHPTATFAVKEKIYVIEDFFGLPFE